MPAGAEQESTPQWSDVKSAEARFSWLPSMNAYTVCARPVKLAPVDIHNGLAHECGSRYRVDEAEHSYWALHWKGILLWY